jgi:hypothetical protein
MSRTVHICLAVAASLSACAADIPAAAQIEVELNYSLTHGDTHQKIEAVLTAKEIGFAYDKYASRYQGIIRSKSSDWRAVIVHIRVDEAQRFLSAEAHDSYTAP